MSSPSSSQEARSDGGARIKNDGRDARMMSFRNFAQHQVRSEFKEEAYKKCDKEIRAFAECAQEKGIMVVFSCRGFNKAVSDCMHVHNSNEAFAKYLEENPGIIEQRTIRSKQI